ncbi:EF-hand domain-containing protein [Azomonas macrocytogenes]|uniref:Ca2+-binding EF-hand superfamily protein n=1 Tax=Azomonas macrocytogenes TaxID=69962 RepID=A0A839TA20_AZOMA|nr:EF-hand domain-containing protein [Azomonas macrocytogenes]MBB3104483.1 Ca2+-binding EF-hand superfamily protein [Azomonas macrocytogenes]
MRKLIALTALVLLGSNMANASDDEQIQKIQEKVQGRLQKQVDAMDTNKDGAISKQEYLTHAEKQFNRMDKDGDGKITQTERGKAFDHVKQLRSE